MARCRELFPRCASCGNAGSVQAVALRLKGSALTCTGASQVGELARKVLNQNTDKALDGAKAHAVQHDGALSGAVGVHVLRSKVERHLEVELDGTALPGATEPSPPSEVDLGAVEGAVALD